MNLLSVLFLVRKGPLGRGGAMAAKLSSLFCFEASGVIFSVQILFIFLP